MSPVIHPTSRPCALHRAFSSKSFVLQPNWLKDATYGTYSVKWVLCVIVTGSHPIIFIHIHSAKQIHISSVHWRINNALLW